MPKLVVANWKANLPPTYNSQFTIYDDLEVAVAAPFPFIDQVPNNLTRAAQDVSSFNNGARTGEVTAEMLRALGVKYCLVGHSERRRLLKETNEIIQEKIKKLKENQIIPILCARNENEILKQVQDDNETIIMFEPQEAISKPGDYHPEDPVRAKAIIDNWRSKFKTRILYGGSVNSENVKDYLFADGYVVGQASLNQKDFYELLSQIKA